MRKKRKMKRNIFRVDTSLKSYTYPIVKIAVFLFLIILGINRNQIYQIHYNSSELEEIVSILFAFAGIMSIFCICIAVAELVYTAENRENMKELSDVQLANKKLYPIKAIVSMVNSNDIIEIRIAFRGEPIVIGASSDFKAGSAKFYDKRFYIGKQEYERVEDFSQALQSYSETKGVFVLSIDDIAPV